MTLSIHIFAAGLPLTAASYVASVEAYPAYIVLLLHPFLFAVIFGALGTRISRRDERICKLLEDEELRCQELCEANQRLTDLDRMKSEFLANVTHELKSPLVTALAYTDRILGRHLGEVTERQVRGLEVSKRNLQRLRGLIDEILDFSRLEAGMARFAMTPVDLRSIAAVAVENLNLKAHEHRIRVVAIAPSRPAMVRGDTNKLCQVLTNLLDNAIKFSPEDSEVDLRIVRENDEYHITVADHGKGIPPEVIPTLFQRFHQADGSLARPHNGVGLGLVIVRKIVDAHGGSVWIESANGKGTTLHVRLPVAAERSTATAIAGNGKEVAHAHHPAD